MTAYKNYIREYCRRTGKDINDFFITQFIIFSITFLISMVSFKLLKLDGIFFKAIVISFASFIPIGGVGIPILIWMIPRAFTGHVVLVCGLCYYFSVLTAVREALELYLMERKPNFRIYVIIALGFITLLVSWKMKMVVFLILLAFYSLIQLLEIQNFDKNYRMMKKRKRRENQEKISEI